MTEIFYIDFKNKKLLYKKEIDSDKDIPDQINLEKLSYFSELITDQVVAVKANTRYEGVDIPLEYKSHLSMITTWSYKFQMTDFAFDEKGIRGTLSFRGKPHFTVLPWGSVWSIALTSGAKPREWREHIPSETHTDGPDDDGPKAA
jgi:hypothetical protein